MSKLGEWIIDAASGPFGSNLKVECFVPDGFPIIDGANLKGVIVTDNITKFVPENKARSLSRSIAKRHDVIVTISGTLGQVAYIPEDSKYEEYLCSQRQFRVTFDETLVDVEYLVYYLHTTEGQKKILSFANYVGVPALSQPLPNFKNIEVTFPDVEIQHQVVKAIKMFDSKISLNNAISAELEALAKTLYDYWFVQFDFPDENGKPYKSSGGKMVWNGELKREIPEEWAVTTVGDITICHDSRRIPVANGDRKKMMGDIPYYGATGIMGYVNKAIFDGDYVLMAEDGSVMDESGHPIIQRISGPCWVNNHAHVLEPTNGFSCRLLMMILGGIPVVQIKTGSIQMKINQENMNSYKIIDIPKHLIDRINEILNPIDKKLLNYRHENNLLANLRDYLLPLLMNGQVIVDGKDNN